MLVSIVTINYNNLEGLRKTIQSVVSQTFENYEFIIIDGGSTDGSVEFIKEYEDKISFWVSEPDKGIYNAMNKGIAKTKGEYINFLNSGDYYISNNVLENIFSNKTYDVAIIRGNQITDFKTHTERWINFGNRNLSLYDLYTSSLHHQAVFFKSDLFIKYGCYNENYKIVSDWEFSLKILIENEKTLYLDIDIIVYEYGGISSNSANKEIVKKERNEILQKYIPEYIFKDYERLKELEIREATFKKYYILLHFIGNHKFPYFLFRIINKIYRIAGLTNKD